jgi:predicted DNA-binding transcriptional regulator AlpA
VEGDRFVSEVGLLTVDDIVEVFRLPSRQAAYDRLRHGSLPRPLRLGRSLRWRTTDIEGFIENGCMNGEVDGS